MSGLSDQELSELVRAADPEPPSEAQVAATRQALLTLAAQTPQARPRARGRWLPMAAAAAAAVLLAAAGLWRVWPEGSAVPRRALVTASGHATFEHGRARAWARW
ncbi:MAG: hypothetical protein H6730_02080 [Deltaproteobacteria bacterium]|nr:hypothetical protein [Deltaproteobacteria bacterium]